LTFDTSLVNIHLQPSSSKTNKEKTTQTRTSEAEHLFFFAPQLRLCAMS